jgi:hypothetical protein
MNEGIPAPQQETEKPLDATLDFILGINPAMATLRAAALVILFFTVWTFFVLISYHPGAADASGDLATQLLNLYFSWQVLFPMLVVFLPFFLALEFACAYQKDIYELPRMSIARRFILQAAFRFFSYENLHITAEKLSPAQLRSPINLIGGPGVVSPDLEYAAVFERPDGTPHFIRAGMSRKERTLQGFERLRRIIDTRDHTFQYHQVTGRTRDGIQLSIQDINLLFSIRRPTRKKPFDYPYLHNLRGIYWLTYQQPAEKWVNAMTELIEEYMLRFIQQHPFGSLLAAYGEPEIAHQIELETSITDIRPQPTGNLADNFGLEAPAPPVVPYFVPRPQLGNFFKNFALEFQRVARLHGVQLEWINVGTWTTQEPVFLAQHVEAWQLTSQNLVRRSPEALAELRNQARVLEIRRLLQEVPGMTYSRLVAGGATNEETLIAMLREYESRARDLIGKYPASQAPRCLTAGLGVITAALAAYTRGQSHHI